MLQIINYGTNYSDVSLKSSCQKAKYSPECNQRDKKAHKKQIKSDAPEVIAGSETGGKYEVK